MTSEPFSMVQNKISQASWLEAEQLDTHRLRTLIAERYNQGAHETAREWALFFELRNGTGASAAVTNYVDAFAMNLWQSKRFWRVSFEFKVSRSDFLRELAKPEKRQWAVDISHEFWFVCAPGVAKKEEIPEGCGLLEANAKGTKLTRVVVAKQRKPRDLRMEEVAAIARRCGDTATMASLTWRLAGKELSAEELAQLLDEKLAAHRDTRMEDMVNERVAKAVRKIQDQFDLYVAQMERAGIEAPAWMREFNPNTTTDTYFDRWLEKNIFPGPNALEVRDALNNQKRSVSALEDALERARNAQDSLKTLLVRKDAAVSIPLATLPTDEL
jgi:hypothetical protein